MASPNDSQAAGDTKTCNACHEEKPLADFRRRANRKNGSAVWWNCRPCMATYDRERAIRLRYGIGQREYLAMLVGQGGGCAICARPPGKRRLHIDHDHATGEVRGLLCYRCNIAVGHLGDSSERLATAIQYLDGQRTGAFVPMTDVSLRARKRGYGHVVS